MVSSSHVLVRDAISELKTFLDENLDPKNHMINQLIMNMMNGTEVMLVKNGQKQVKFVGKNSVLGLKTIFVLKFT